MHYQFRCTCIKSSTATRTVQCDKKKFRAATEMEQGIGRNELAEEICRLRAENNLLREEVHVLQFNYEIMKGKSISFVY